MGIYGRNSRLEAADPCPMKSERAKFWTRWAYVKGYRVLDDGTLLNPSGKRLRATPSSSGYPTFKVGSHKAQYTLQLHVFAAYCRYGEKALEAECVRHKDDVRTNCTRLNLRLGTRVDNAADLSEETRLRVGRNANASRHARTASTRSKRDKRIVKLRAAGKTWRAIGQIVGLDKARIGRILREQGSK